MKVDRLETHDRLLEFSKQSDYISQGCVDCICNRPKEYANHPFYIFAHKRSLGMDEKLALFNEDLRLSFIDPLYLRRYQTLADVPEARLLWEPRLTKPTAQINSMLFKAYPPGDNIKIIWMIPAEELWASYENGKMTENKMICESIQLFKTNRGKLEERESDDISEELIKNIMCEIGANARKRRK